MPEKPEKPVQGFPSPADGTKPPFPTKKEPAEPGSIKEMLDGIFSKKKDEPQSENPGDTTSPDKTSADVRKKIKGALPPPPDQKPDKAPRSATRPRKKAGTRKPNHKARRTTQRPPSGRRSTRKRPHTRGVENQETERPPITRRPSQTEIKEIPPLHRRLTPEEIIEEMQVAPPAQEAETTEPTASQTSEEELAQRVEQLKEQVSTTIREFIEEIRDSDHMNSKGVDVISQISLDVREKARPKKGKLTELEKLYNTTLQMIEEIRSAFEEWLEEIQAFPPKEGQEKASNTFWSKYLIY